MWAVLLVTSVLAGVWLSARHWWGWLVSAGSEVLWYLDGLAHHDGALMALAWALFIINLRNAALTWRDSRVARASDL